MNAKSLFTAFVALWFLSVGNLAFGDDDVSMDPVVPAVSVNINTDTAEVIAENLTGVGLTRAQAIVSYRESYGPFYSAEELTAVRGIGKSTVMKNADRIVIE